MLTAFLPLAAILLQGVAAQAGQESGYTVSQQQVPTPTNAEPRPAEGSYSPSPSASPSPAASPVSNAKGQDKYTMYTGNGDAFPSMSDWESYEDLWNGNKDLIQSSCSTWSVPNNSDTEMQNLHDEIQSVSTSANIDPRFTLAILLQESSGCVRVPTTNNGVTNPGLMQSHAGTGTCNDGSGNVQTPCPKSEIHQMIADGVSGTSGGDGLKQILDEYGPKPFVAKSYYRAARVYNSGQLDGEDLNDGFASTACYVNDIANRLTGWVHAKEGCSVSRAVPRGRLEKFPKVVGRGEEETGDEKREKGKRGMAQFPTRDEPDLCVRKGGDGIVVCLFNA